MSRATGCEIRTLEENDCKVLLQWISIPDHLESNKIGSIADLTGGIQWLLAHCYDGVTWGYLRDGKWKLSSDVFADLCPPISTENLLELRLFGKNKEILIWRDGNGVQGRIVSDCMSFSDDDSLRPTEEKRGLAAENSQTTKTARDSLRPTEEKRVLLGDYIIAGPKEGFTRVRSADGKEQALPLELVELENYKERPQLIVKHYFEQVPHTGAERVAVSRLVSIDYESRGNNHDTHALL